ncbi:hypothetical protein SAMN04488523_104164 [Sulfitobacter brevis]|uniref:Uncharacterized protein n=1 Tax=Sulfitobacter brevis TaxID=74348 RepID=A0A1I1WW56_9RHOB|nr:hypothetical protein [Sulfitobacter brevis]SFD99367.1 hypothetical protein SAMN04488523_104164 [Sulfitobacter brevis]
MNIVLGIGTLAVTALLFAYAYGAHRRPVPSRWTRVPALSMLTCVAFTLMGPVGLGFLVTAALSPARELATTSVIGLVIAAALALMAVISCPLLVRPARKTSARAGEVAADNANAAPSIAAAVA